MTTSATTPRRQPALDGVRAVASYGVIATHVGFNSGRSLDNGPFAPFLARLDFGVTLFFLLSGFLLYRPFALSALSKRPAPRIGSFWWRRLLRIAPAYWLAVTVTLAMLTTLRVTGPEWRSYLLLTQTYEHHDTDTSLSHMWTLAVEISFYAALPLLAYVGRTLARYFRPVGGQLVLIALLGSAALTANIVCHVVGGDATISLLWLPAYLDWFGLGMLLAVASSHRAAAGGWARTLRHWAAAPGTCWLIGGLLFWLSTLPICGPLGLLPSTDWEWTTKHLLYGATAFFLMLPVVLGTSGVVWRVLGNPVMSWLGKISYGVFLWHLPILLAIQRWLGWAAFSGHFAALYGLTALSATAAASLSWYALERPLLARFSRPSTGLGLGSGKQAHRDQADELRSGASGERMG